MLNQLLDEGSFEPSRDRLGERRRVQRPHAWRLSELVAQ